MKKEEYEEIIAKIKTPKPYLRLEYWLIAIGIGLLIYGLIIGYVLK